MALANVHLEQAKHNKKTAKKLANISILDWAVTSAFYSALHFIEFSFINDPNIGGHTEDKYNSLKINEPDSVRNMSIHSLREILMGSKFSKDNIKSKYVQLRTMSEACRYIEKSGGKTGYSFISPDDVKRGLDDLDKIEKAVSV